MGDTTGSAGTGAASSGGRQAGGGGESRRAGHPAGGKVPATQRFAADARVVALTGACTFLGSELIKRLEEDRRYRRILALDVRKPDLPFEKTEFHPIDLTMPTVHVELTDLLRRERVDTVVHGAFLSHPTHASDWAHELEDVGTMHVLDACMQAVPARFLLLSTTLVYGASPRNPNFLGENAPLRGQSGSRFINDKVRAEQQVQRFAETTPATMVTTLRFAPILGPTVRNLFTRFFSRPVAPVLLGHDPLVQLLHELDAVDALKLALDREVTGPVNVVGRGVLPYTTVLALMGRLPLRLPYTVARPLSHALWTTQLSRMPPSFVEFLRHLCVADGTRARSTLGFTARFPIQRTIFDFLGVNAEEGVPDIAHAQG